MHFEGFLGSLAQPACCGVLKSHTKMKNRALMLNFFGLWTALWIG